MDRFNLTTHESAISSQRISSKRWQDYPFSSMIIINDISIVRNSICLLPGKNQFPFMIGKLIGHIAVFVCCPQDRHFICIIRFYFNLYILSNIFCRQAVAMVITRFRII